MTEQENELIFPGGAVSNGYGAHFERYSLSTGCLYHRSKRSVVKLTTNLYIVPVIEFRGSVPLLTDTFIFHVPGRSTEIYPISIQRP